jgi:hypothetical protein
VLACLLLLLLASLPGVAPAAGSDPGECPKWFPDLRCDREGRPAGSVPPMTMPYLFEDPYITTGLQFAYIRNDFPGRSVFRGGHASVFALQLRVAVTDRLALIAVRDGLMSLHPDVKLSDIDPTLPDSSLIDSANGRLMDIAVGVKYALIDDRERSFILTPSLRFEIPSGDNDVLQGEGRGLVVPAVSVGWGLERYGLDAVHLVGAVGAQLPFDGDRNSTSIFYNLQVGYRLAQHLAPFVAINGMSYVDDGDGSQRVKTTLGTLDVETATRALGLSPFEGLDVVNLGSRDVDGNDVITAALGARVPIDRHLSLGFAWEHPITRRKDIVQNRWTFMTTYEF